MVVSSLGRSSIAPAPIEVELLLSCAKFHINQNIDQTIQGLIQNSIDWEKFVNLVYSHEISPLIYWSLKEIVSDKIPKWVMDDLRSVFNVNARKQFVFTGELLRLNTLFNQNNIPILFLKGPILSCMGYKNPLCREFVDLDILVSREFIAQARQILITQGYEPVFNLSQEQLSIYWKLTNEEAFIHPAKRVIIDLHWSLLSENFSFIPPQNWIWNCKDIVHISKNSIQTLSTECLLLFLCVHGAKHGWSNLKLVCDVAGLIRYHPNLNWDWVMFHKNYLGTQKMFFLGLCLCHNLLSIELPSEIVSQIEKDLEIQSLVDRVEVKLLKTEPKRSKFFEMNWVYLQTMNSWQDKLKRRVLMHLSPTALELQFISIPFLLYPLYYFVRPIRLLIKYLNLLGLTQNSLNQIP